MPNSVSLAPPGSVAGQPASLCGQSTVKHRVDDNSGRTKQSVAADPCRMAFDAGAWVPDPVQLMHLAALIYPDKCRNHRADEALEQAWAIFVQSKAFCAELQAMSAEELSLRYGTTRGINHTSKVIKNILGSVPRGKMLRFYPYGHRSDTVCDYLGKKQPRAVRERLQRYFRAHKEEGDDSPYESFLYETERRDENGIKYHELSVEFLEKLVAYEKQVKSDGGKRKTQDPRPVLSFVVRDEDDATVTPRQVAPKA